MKRGSWPVKVRLILGLYSFLYWIAIPLWLIGAIFKALPLQQNLKQILGRLGFGLKKLNLKECFWIHAVSAGEVAATAIMLPALKRQLEPDLPLVLTTTTKSGFLMAKNRLPKEVIVRVSPLDAVWVVRRFFKHLKPRVLAVAEIEIWPNLFRQASRHGTPLAIFNARLSDVDHRRYLRFRWLFSPILGLVRVIAAQSAEDGARYAGIGAPSDRIRIAGNIKNDQVWSPSFGPELGESEIPLVVVISTHPKEEELVFEACRGLELGLALAPRAISRSKKLLKTGTAFGYRASLLSSLGSDLTKFKPLAGDLLILDAYGEVLNFTLGARLAIIGGSFSQRVQGHNPIEPAALGVPVIFGPEMGNFREAREALLARGGGVEVRDGVELRARLLDWLEDEARATQAGRLARATVEGLGGASSRTAQLLGTLALEQKKFDY